MNPPRCLQPPMDRAAMATASHVSVLPRIDTERLVLRAPCLADAALWSELISEPDSFVGYHTPEEAWEAFCVYTAGWLLHGHGLLAITCKPGDDAIGFVHVGLEWADEEPELGYMLAPTARGKGYATEAAAALRNHPTSLLGPGAFVSYIAAKNVPSNRLAARLGAHRDSRAEAATDRDTNVWRHGAVE